ncbi:MAG: CBS domain-containing protein [Alphaproteobacteria bacterium]|nr:CBS domain-containing protein [Alphaproteobacteria bacterium]
MPNDNAADGAESLSLLQRLFSRSRAARGAADIADAIDNGRFDEVDELSPARREMIERVIAFDQKRVDDVMAPRADIVGVEVNTPLDELIKAFADAGHSRLPIYRGDLDDPIGMVHVKDCVDLIAHPEKQLTVEGPILKHLRRDVIYAPPSMRVTDLLLRMQASRIHMALVVDEYGGTDGLVTIEDLVEQIVGEINDEHDDEETPTVADRGGAWDADARVELDDFREATGVDLALDDEEIDTLGGLAVTLAGRVPQRGEVLSHPAGYDLEIIGADARKVRKLTIRSSSTGGSLPAKVTPRGHERERPAARPSSEGASQGPERSERAPNDPLPNDPSTARKHADAPPKAAE